MSGSLSVISIATYPLKSGRGFATEDAFVTKTGLRYDRRWMIVDRSGQFMTARNHPGLLRLKASPLDQVGHIQIHFGDGESLTARPISTGGRRSVQVWSSNTFGLSFAPSVNERLSEILQTECALVYMDDTIQRRISNEDQRIVSYADGYPLLLTTQASLKRLNRNISPPVDMPVFRPNLVVDGGTAFEERGWTRVKIGDVTFESGGDCIRCSLTTRDPLTGVRRTDGQPLKALAEMQRHDNGVVFGINLIPLNEGMIRSGDPVVPIP